MISPFRMAPPEGADLIGGCRRGRSETHQPHPRRAAASRGEYSGRRRPFAPAISRRRPEPAAFDGSPPGLLPGKRAAISRPYDVAGNRCVRRWHSDDTARRTRDARPYGENRWPGGNVGADAHIGPSRVSGLNSRGGICALAVFPRPPAGNFSPQKSSQNAPGAAAPGLPWAPRRASQGEALPKLLRSTGLSRPILPAPSRLRAGQ